MSKGTSRAAAMSPARSPGATAGEPPSSRSAPLPRTAADAKCAPGCAARRGSGRRSRAAKEDSGITAFLGDKLIKNPATAILPGRLLTADGTASTDNKGSVQRQENLQTSIAAVVTQVLPNGNLVVEGKQEIRVNFEIRELIVAGIVRPEDIQSDNTIEFGKIAQARIAYGGRGQITDVQQPRYGQQFMDVILPF